MLLAHEREMLGLYVSDHPLLGLEAQLRTLSEGNIADLAGSDNADGKVVTVSGLVTSVVRRVTKGGKPYAQMVVEDLTGEIQMMVFPKAYEAYSPYCHTDAIVVVKGRFRSRRGLSSHDGHGCQRPRPVAGPEHPFVVTVSAQQCTPTPSNDSKPYSAPTPEVPKCTCGWPRVHAPLCCASTRDSGFRPPHHWAPI